MQSEANFDPGQRFEHDVEPRLLERFTAAVAELQVL
jgi:hypothetical protein